MILNWQKTVSAFYIFSCLTGCAGVKLIKDQEYNSSIKSFRLMNPTKALVNFPQKENTGFITTLEKHWLKFWDDKSTPLEISHLFKTIDERKFISLSREGSYLFFGEAEDGYLPSEHEMLVLYLTNAMTYLRLQKWSDARIEAKKAAEFFQSYFNIDQNKFDDPALRIWLAAIWAALGEWDEAKVDLRNAYAITKSDEILKLLNSPVIPKQLYLKFYGNTPALSWQNGESLPKFSNVDDMPNDRIVFSTLGWYERHLVRNNYLREQILKSNFMSRFYTVKMSATAEQTAVYTAGLTLIGTGVAVAVFGYAYLSTLPNLDPRLLALPAIPAALIVGAGVKAIDTGIADAKKSEQERLDAMRTYRFVRFLPNWISLDTEQRRPKWNLEYTFMAPFSETNVHCIHEF